MQAITVQRQADGIHQQGKALVCLVINVPGINQIVRQQIVNRLLQAIKALLSFCDASPSSRRILHGFPYGVKRALVP